MAASIRTSASGVPLPAPAAAPLPHPSGLASTPPSSPTRASNAQSPKTTPIKALEIKLASPTQAAKIRTIIQTGAPFSPRTQNAFVAARAKLIGLPKNSPRKRRGKAGARAINAFQRAITRDPYRGRTSSTDRKYHELGTEALKSPTLKTTYQDLFDCVKGCKLAKPDKKKLSEGRIINFKHVAKGETNARGLRVGWHWIDLNDSYDVHVDTTVQVVNSKTGVAVAPFTIPGYRRKRSSFFPSNLFNVNAITREKDLIKVIRKAKIKTESPGESRFLAKAKWNKKTIWVEGFKVQDTDSYHTVYPLFLCEKLPTSSDVTIVKRGSYDGDHSYQMKKTAAQVKRLVEDTLEDWTSHRRGNCPVHFIKGSGSKQRVWVDIASHIKSTYRSFPLTAGVVFECKVKKLTLSTAANAELGAIKARLS